MATFDEKIEMVYQTYKRTLDLEVSLVLVPLSEEDRDALRNDEDLKALIAVSDAQMKERLIVRLQNIADTSLNDGVALSAVGQLGKMFYPTRFKNETIDVNVVSYKVIGRRTSV